MKSIRHAWFKRFSSSLMVAAVGSGTLGDRAAATPAFVEHLPVTQVFGEPAGVTMRESDVPREDEAIDIWVRIAFSFYYTDVAIYYTIDGSTPGGTRGVPSGTTAVLTPSGGAVNFIRNEPSLPANIDWWKATLPASTRVYGTNVKYIIGA